MLNEAMMRTVTMLIFGFSLLGTAIQAEIRKFDRATIEKLGVAIYEQDIRAAAATDLMYENKINAVEAHIRGWIVEGDAKSMLVRFVCDNGGKMEAAYDISFVGKQAPVLRKSTNPELSATQIAQFKARSLVGQHITRPASNRYNVVISPDPEGDRWLVYALAATTEPNAIMVGGHYRFTVSKDGERLERSDELFKDFMVLSSKPPDLPEGSSVAALTMTTLVSNLPLETHVYLSLLHHMTFYVGTADQKVWKVEHGKIQEAN